MKYNKLVRDRIPEIIKKDNRVPITHIADDAEYWQKLKEKILEESQELLEAETEENTKEELADIYEIIDAMIEFKNFDKNEILRIQQEKGKKRGKFKDKIILEES